MILVITKMNVIPEKFTELTQTISSLAGFTRSEKGCEYCELCQNIEDINNLFLLEEWDSQENLTAHMKTEHFDVFLGALHTLTQPYKRTLHLVLHPAGTEAH
jgi:quinol monooxygenase YgiN